MISSRRPRRLMAATVLVLLGLTAMAMPAEAQPTATDASRSVESVFTNKSDRGLSLSGHNLDHGCWTSEPPKRVEPGQTVRWESESCGTATGTEGTAFYRVDGEGNANLRLHWNNPFVGSNSYDQDPPQGYVAGHDGGDGNNATVDFGFDCNSTTCDGIPDDWKRNGVTVDPGNGLPKQFINLPAMGADVNKPDIFIQLDWMADNTPGNVHNHAFDAAAIRKVAAAFANSPYRKHSPTTGINLHVDAGPNSVLNFATGQTWGALSQARQLAETANLGTVDADNRYVWTDFNALKQAPGGFVSSGRSPIFHYAIAAHNLNPGSTSSGIAPYNGNDLIVSLGSFTSQVGTVNEQAGTLMHELGHNLGLDHGGNEGTNNKPQYFSVMNYSYQFSMATATTTGIIDYSRSDNSLNEPFLDENTPPASAGTRYDTSHYCPATSTLGAGFVTAPSTLTTIDWDCDGVTDSDTVPVDTNNDGAITSLSGYDDWSRLQLRGGTIGRPGTPPVPQPTPMDELTPSVAAQILPVDSTAPVTAATPNPPPNGAGYNNTDVAVALNATDDISGAVRTEFAVDGGSWAQYTTPVVIGAPGVHVLSYRSIDRAQNVEQARTLTVRIDKQAPVTTASLAETPNSAGWIAKDGTVALHAVDEPGGSGVQSVTYSTTGAQTTPATTVPGDSTSFKIGQEGETVITYQATDRAGNTEPARTLTVRVDKTAPVSRFETKDETIFVAVAVGAPDTQFVTGTATDAAAGVDHVTVTYKPVLFGDPITAAATLTCTDVTKRSCTWKIPPPRGLGRYLVTTTATDVAGNVETAGAPIHITVVRLT